MPKAHQWSAVRMRCQVRTAAATPAEAVRGPNSGKAIRAGTTVRKADGTVTHNSGFKASGANGGSLASTRSLDQTASGTTAERDTTATGKAGNTYTGETTYDSATGLTHSGTCTDAGGNVIPCRR
jgi:hypothetical protein